MSYTAVAQPRHSFVFFIFLFVASGLLLNSCGPDQSSTGPPANNLLEISAISPDSGFVGDQITITASGLLPQPQKGVIAVRFNGIQAKIISIVPGKLIAKVPSGATSGAVSLEMAGKTTSGPFFKVLAHGPTITSVTPLKGSPGTQITITGQHFLLGAINGSSNATNPPKVATVTADSVSATSSLSGPPLHLSGKIARQTITELPATHVVVAPLQAATPKNSNTTSAKLTINVTVGGVLAPILSISDNKIIIQVPEGAAAGLIVVTVAGQTDSWKQFQVITAPSIASMTPKQGPIATTVTLKGTGFSSTPDSNAVTFNGTPATVTKASDIELTVAVPSGATTGVVKVTTNGQTATGPTFTVTEASGPQVSITDVSPKEGPQGTSVTITGKNFSTIKTDNTVTFNGTKATVSSASETKLVATVPNEATTGPVKVKTDGQTATGPTFTVTEASGPQVQITDISPKSGYVGQKVTITGKNFSSTKADNTVAFNGTKTTISSASTTKLVVKVPFGATSGPVKVKTNGQTATGPTFSVTTNPASQLTISDISPKTGPVGTSVIITGQNFSATTKNNTVTFNGTKAAVSSASTTKLVVKAPAGATTGPVKVKVGSQTDTGPTFTVTTNPANRLTINDITPKTGPVGTSVTIKGQNFSATAKNNTVTFNGTKATVQKASTTKLTVSVPQGATTGNVKVKVGSQTDTGPTFTVTQAQGSQVSISDISPKTGPVGTAVTITGQNFSAIAKSNTVTFNGTKAAVSSASTTKLVVKAPAGATTGPVKVAVGGQTATGPNFTVMDNHAPKIVSSNSYKVKENTKAVGTIKATDPDGDALTYSTTGGADANAFTIDKTSGKLAFKTAPDYENPSDANGDNVYEVKVKANDGSLSDTQTVQVTVQNEPEAPVFKSAVITTGGHTFTANGSGGTFTFQAVPAGADLTSGGLTVKIDPSVDPVKQVSFGGADGSLFSLKTNGGHKVTLSGPVLDYKHGADHQYRFSITFGALGSAAGATTWTFTIPVQSPFAGGSGTASDPYQVTTLKQLQLVGQFLSAHFIQIADIDASPTSGWNGGKGFAPIGSNSRPFTGSYDGNGYTISGLTINRPNQNTVGLFGRVESGGLVEHVALTGIDISGKTNTGGLVGNNGGIVSFSYATGTVSGEQGVGGLVGANYGKVTQSYATVTVNGTASYAGGLVGYSAAHTTIRSSYATGKVTGNKHVGGLVGFGTGSTITNSYWDTQTTGQGSSDGGTGLTTYQMVGAQAKSNMSGFDFTSVWQTNAHYYPTLRDNPQPGHPKLSPNPFAGGSGTASDPYQVATLKQLQLVGQFLSVHFIQTADIDASATSGWNGGNGFEPIGSYIHPFTGSYDGDGHTISGLTIDRPNADKIGLFGFTGSGSALTNVALIGADITGNFSTGGLVGSNQSSITGSYVTGSVSGGATSGGLVGINNLGGTVTKSYATCSVDINSSSYVGGLAGQNVGNISDSYSTGSVNSINGYSGGLVGINSVGGSITNTYAAGSVNGNASISGGLVASNNSGSVSGSYWDTQTTGQGSSAGGGTGLQTNQMQDTAAKTNMSGFDFTNVWKVRSGDYPALRGVAGQP